MPQGLPRRIKLAFIVQALVATLVITVGIVVGGLAVRQTLLHDQLRREAQFFWEERGADPAHPLPRNSVMTAYLDRPALPGTGEPCPKCGKTVVENYRRFACTKCDFSIPKHPGSRSLEIDEVEELLREGTIGPLSGFISKMGRPFSAVLKLTPEFKLEFDFGQAAADEANGAAIDFSGQHPVGACPKCGGRVFEQPMNYLCERSTGPDRSCDFRSGKVILQQPIERAQMEKLLNEGRTDILRGFVSNRTRRKFNAFLVRKPDGTVGFEFEPRAKKPAGKAAARTKGESTSTDTAAPALRKTVRAASGDGDAAPTEGKSTTVAARRPGTTARKSTKSVVKHAAKAPARKPAKSAKSAKTVKAARK
jgi:DNA topoisomerase-3